MSGQFRPVFSEESFMMLALASGRIRVSFVTLTLLALGAGCSSKTSAPILDRVESQVPAGQTSVQVIAAYSDAQAAAAAAESLKAKGATVESIDSSGKIQKITAETA